MKNINAKVLVEKNEVSVNDLIWEIENSVQFYIYELKENNYLIETFKESSEVKLNTNLASNEVAIDDLIQAIDNCDDFTIWRSKENENNFTIEVF